MSVCCSEFWKIRVCFVRKGETDCISFAESTFLHIVVWSGLKCKV